MLVGAAIFALLGLVAAIVAVTLAMGGGGGSGRTAAQNRGSATDYRDELGRFVNDIESFWNDEYPALFGGRMTALRQGILPASPGTTLPRCANRAVTYKDVQDNAFYCPSGDFITYDDAEFFPTLAERYGLVALGTVLAHEYGHAVQARRSYDASSVVVELQADCYAGAWLAHADKSMPSIGDDEKISALVAILSFSDPAGTTSDEQNAHGSAFDRVTAFTDGLRNTAKACTTYDDARPTFQIPFRSLDDLRSGGNLPFAQLVPGLEQALGVTIQPASRSCSVPKGDYVARCKTADTLAYVPEAEQLADRIGDFSFGFLVLQALADRANPYCETGTQMRSLLDDRRDFSLSPGDIDEAIITLVLTARDHGDSFPTIVDHIDRLGRGLTGSSC